MQNTQPHPSLPKNPNASVQTSSVYPAYYNSHYLQAYTQLFAPTQSYHTTNSNADSDSTWAESTGTSRSKILQPSVSTWYHPGNQRCSYQGCSFSGSHKSVEVHMMDRHLIYPPGWQKEKKRSEWDADPSLKGKPVPIQGTNVVLDSPEVLAAWIAERRRRFPTSSLVEGKKRKMEEAVARGQLDPTALGLRSNKRPRTDNQGQISKHPPRNGTSGKNGEPIRVPDSGWGAKVKSEPTPIAKTTRPVVTSSLTLIESDSDDDAAPEVVSSKTVSTIELPFDTEDFSSIMKVVAKPFVPEKSSTRKPPPVQPKVPPRNPFASRPTLLRNLLLPEIRMTVSNLSQAIRFLVDNDFLRDVELKPGQAIERSKIEVVPSRQDTGHS